MSSSIQSLFLHTSHVPYFVLQDVSLGRIFTCYNTSPLSKMSMPMRDRETCDLIVNDVISACSTSELRVLVV